MTLSTTAIAVYAATSEQHDRYASASLSLEMPMWQLNSCCNTSSAQRCVPSASKQLTQRNFLIQQGVQLTSDM